MLGKPTENRARKTHRKLQEDTLQSPFFSHWTHGLFLLFGAEWRLKVVAFFVFFSLELQQVEQDDGQEEVAGAPGCRRGPVHIMDCTRACGSTEKFRLSTWVFYLCHHLLFPSATGLNFSALH